jgi:FkbM family methyltransferase
MNIGGRRVSKVCGAAFSSRHYLAAWNIFKLCDQPFDAITRYIFLQGSYPTSVGIKTPLGKVSIELFTAHDILTINEVFCRLDYYADARDKIIVDFGSNIGISALYFLSRSEDVFAYLFEPFPPNVRKLKLNLSTFQSRFHLNEVAVGLSNGIVDFGWEPSGRYGGVGRQTGNSTHVNCVDSNEILEAVLARHTQIDILKIDIETLERDVILRIPYTILRRIKKIYVEYPFRYNPLMATHRWKQYGPIAQFTNSAMV